MALTFKENTQKILKEQAKSTCRKPYVPPWKALAPSAEQICNNAGENRSMSRIDGELHTLISTESTAGKPKYKRFMRNLSLGSYSSRSSGTLNIIAHLESKADSGEEHWFHTYSFIDLHR